MSAASRRSSRWPQRSGWRWSRTTGSKRAQEAAAADLLSEDGVVCCTHGDIVEALLGRGLKKGAAVVLDDGAVVREIPPPK